MKIINDFNEYINENKCKIIIFDDKIYISNYFDIKSFDTNKFILKSANKLIVLEGKNISIQKLTKDEILISGDINTIELR
ncbi:MAG: hypothetical protein E7166_03805 [Firmicutes bacterium]|nr:hypothetical protein [Bacillota bacterium]